MRRLENRTTGVIEISLHQRKVDGLNEDINFHEYYVIIELLAVDISAQGEGIATDLIALAKNIA